MENDEIVLEKIMETYFYMILFVGWLLIFVTRIIFRLLATWWVIYFLLHASEYLIDRLFFRIFLHHRNNQSLQYILFRQKNFKPHFFGVKNTYLAHVSEPVLYLLLSQSRGLREFFLVWLLQIWILKVFDKPTLQYLCWLLRVLHIPLRASFNKFAATFLTLLIHITLRALGLTVEFIIIGYWRSIKNFKGRVFVINIQSEVALNLIAQIA